MRKSLSLVIGLLLVGAVVFAQTVTHDNMKEKKASDEVTFSTDVKVGTALLKAGRYKIVCDSKTIKFSLLTADPGPGNFIYEKKVLEVPCQGKQLDARRENTSLTMPVGKDGVAVLEKLYLKGSNIEHVFPN